MHWRLSCPVEPFIHWQPLTSQAQPFQATSLSRRSHPASLFLYSRLYSMNYTQWPQDLVPQTHLCKPPTPRMTVFSWLWTVGLEYTLTLISSWFSRSSQYPQSSQSLHDYKYLQHHLFSILLKQFYLTPAQGILNFNAHINALSLC